MVLHSKNSVASKPEISDQDEDIFIFLLDYISNSYYFRCHDIWHNGTEKNDAQHNRVWCSVLCYGCYDSSFVCRSALWCSGRILVVAVFGVLHSGYSYPAVAF